MKKILFFFTTFLLLNSNLISKDLLQAKEYIEGVTCLDFYPNLVNIKNLKNEIETKGKLMTVYPEISPKFEIIWHDNKNIKAIIDQDHKGLWNGAIHSWYQSGEYLGCAGLKDSEHEGISIAYHKNGKIRAMANFKNGMPHGLEYQFSIDGILRGTKNHDGNNLNNTKKNKHFH